MRLARLLTGTISSITHYTNTHTPCSAGLATDERGWWLNPVGGQTARPGRKGQRRREREGGKGRRRKKEGTKQAREGERFRLGGGNFQGTWQ